MLTQRLHVPPGCSRPLTKVADSFASAMADLHTPVFPSVPYLVLVLRGLQGNMKVLENGRLPHLDQWSVHPDEKMIQA